MAYFFPASSLLLLLIFLPVAVHGVGVFSVQRKFAGNDNPPVAELRKHNALRHSRLLSTKPMAIDIPLGGNLPPIGLYYAEIAIGTPPRKFSVQMDTGSGVLWVNCQPCIGCTENATIRAQLTIYDPKDSKTARIVSCYDSLCKTLMEEQSPEELSSFPDMLHFCESVKENNSSTNDVPCPLDLFYGDYRRVHGSYVTDLFTYNQVLGDDKTLAANANITFGCASEQRITEEQQAGLLTSGVDGIIGFMQTKSSMISQLASSGKARKIFAHCLDTNKGGGIFAIGHVVEPKVRTTPLLPNMARFIVNMKSIQVGKEFLQLPTNLFETGDGIRSGTMIDSGSTSVLLPPASFRPLLEKIFSNHPTLSLKITDTNATFSKYSGSKNSVDEDFPDVTFYFENSLTLNVKPHDYLIQEEGIWHVGFECNEAMMGNLTLFGDIALSNKLVVYDFEKQTIGWEEYDCTSSITIEDAMSGKAYKVGAHNVLPQYPSCPSPNPSPSPNTS